MFVTKRTRFDFRVTDAHQFQSISVEASIANSVSEVSRVLDTKMMDFEKRLDRQIGKAAEVVAANAAAANSQIQHPRGSGSGSGSSYWIQAPASAQAEVHYAPSQPQHTSSASEVSDALIRMSLARAEAAELRVSELQVSPYSCMLAHES